MKRHSVDFNQIFDECSRGMLGWVNGYLSILESPTVIILPNGVDTMENIFAEPAADENGVPDRVLFSFTVNSTLLVMSRTNRRDRIRIGSLQLPWKSPDEIFRNVSNGYHPREFHEELKNYFSHNPTMTWFLNPVSMLTKNSVIIKISVIGIPSVLYQQNREESRRLIGRPNEMLLEDFRSDDEE